MRKRKLKPTTLTKQERPNNFFTAVAAKICAYLVRVHYALYFVFGILLMFLDRILGMHILQGNEPYLLVFVWPPIILLFLVQSRLFCVHFYQERIRELVPLSPYGRATFDMPGIDTTFYETIIGDIGLSRKLAGYMYALSKPTTFTLIGATSSTIFMKNF